MPRTDDVEQVTPRKRKSKKSIDVESMLRDVSEQKGGIKLSMYGKSKTGKTRLACTFPKPLLLLGVEDGTRSVSDVKGVKFLPVTHPDIFDAGVEYAREKKFKSVVLDTAGGLESLCLMVVLGLDEMPINRKWGMARQQDWGACQQKFKSSVNEFFKLAKDGIHTVVIAHEKNFNDDEDEENILVAHVGSALTPGSVNWLNGEADFIGQCFIRRKFEVESQVLIEGEDPEEVEIDTGEKEYCLRIGPHEKYQTGFRNPSSRDNERPDVIGSPTFAKIKKLV